MNRCIGQAFQNALNILFCYVFGVVFAYNGLYMPFIKALIFFLGAFVALATALFYELVVCLINCCSDFVAIWPYSSVPSCDSDSSDMPAAKFVIAEMAATFRPQCLATITSATVE